MNTLFKLLSGIVLLGVTGCDISNIDKPSPAYVSMWEKPGADSTEVGKALLECGMPSLIDLDTENRERSNNAKATTYACMIQAGFRYKNEYIGGWCYTFKEENLPICRSGAVVPQRSVKKRLNSPFCKRYKNADECQP
ncbi:hypothetical protein [Bartonella tribocorum]|uniref:Phage protein n=1 Tax=Bartonella tribocorum (strain DSM 28219 / CCUG 45778 / CIP 105476 / IBS 506) TaxID=382640 RepID=A9IP42_BART1|nr:hypothetical protein [Bartonella tribocorum]CAK00876.1 hypothetical protein BT_0420 [Bartonella tribocorum CIP 105476]CDO48076.1 hypothetical protein BM1374166_00385 [Bartonella tribocorum]